MSYRLLFTLILSGLLFSCQNNKKESQKTENVKVDEFDNNFKTELIFTKFKALHSELLEFKGNEDFKNHGFQHGGPYHEWLKKVRAFKENPDSKLLLKKGVLVGELEQLGLAYASSKGKETEVTQSLNQIFSNAIASKPTEKIEFSSGNITYNKLKSEYEFFGKWRITNSITKSSYPYEIYKKGSEYIGIIPQDKFKTEILERNGNKYFIKGNKYGEYYIISSAKELTLFDKDGELASMGYKATIE